jgi:ABC-type branched-subunit amino acid transport system substrate-binding protein
MAEQVTVKDLQVILKALDTSDDKIHTCIGTSGTADSAAAAPVIESHDAVMINPLMGGRGR